MKAIVVSVEGKETINNFFSTNEVNGLYFRREWNRDTRISKLQQSSYLSSYGANEGNTKKIEYLSSNEIKSFDNFTPKNNLTYFVYTKEKGLLNQYFFEEPHSYLNCKQLAEKLILEGSEVVIAEEYLKIKTIIHREEGMFHPFSEEKTTHNIFIWHSRTKSFSNLISLEEENNLSFEDLLSWFSMGYATLFFAQRVAYFLDGEVVFFEKEILRDKSYSVYSKTGHLESFKNFDKALAFCQTENSKTEIGSEFLISISIKTNSWH
jgi:hypothetical protein